MSYQMEAKNLVGSEDVNFLPPLRGLANKNVKKCGTQGHNSKQCLNPGPSSNRTIPDAYRWKCSLCHEIGHNEKTRPKKEEIVGHNL